MSLSIQCQSTAAQPDTCKVPSWSHSVMAPFTLTHVTASTASQDFCLAQSKRVSFTKRDLIFVF